MRRSRLLVGAAALLMLLPAGSASADEGGNILFSNVPKRLAANYGSYGNEAYSIKELGDHVRFEGRKRTLKSVTVVLSSWACEAGRWYTPANDPCRTRPGARFTHPLTLNIYKIGDVTNPIASQTQTFRIPYRPSADLARCGDGRWYNRSDKTCYNGLATEITFRFGSGVTLPDEVIWSIAYNTSSHGYAPIGTAPCSDSSGGCPYDSLNVALNDVVRAGSDVNPETAWVNSTWAGFYCDGGPGGTFREDVATPNSDPPCSWGGASPMAEIKAVGGDDDDDDDDD